MAQSPPVYQSAPAYAPSTTPLPAYSRRRPSRPSTARRESTEHVFDLRNKHNNVWALWKISSAARGQEHLPTYLEGDLIKGSLYLNLDHPDPILSITIRVAGQITAGNRPEDIFTFLDLPVVLWSRDGSGESSPTSPNSPRASSGKLHGEYTWPIHIPIPKEVLISSSNSRGASNTTIGGSTLQSYQLPQTFMERHTRASVQYSILLRIQRSAFRSDSEIKTLFIYVPAIQPGPPSMLRQLAYQENSPLLGPEADPDGWKTFPPITIRGRIFNARDVELNATLSLATPFSYTRGSAIPCHLVLGCPDPQALDLLATSRSITLCLRRRVRPSQGTVQAEHTWDLTVTRANIDEDVATAVWWPSAEGANQATPTKRVLDGEIKLPKNLKPSSLLAHFSVTYRVILLPFRAATFMSMRPEPIFEHPVEIATVFATGPRAKSYAPPEYDEVPKSSHRPSSSRPGTGGVHPTSAVPWALSA